jgi:hypothetical protein
VGALVRGRVLWLGLAARERGDDEGEGECYSVRELGLASGERREFIVFYLYCQHKTLVRDFFLNRFGSVRVNRFLHYKTENRTEPVFFLNILIGLIGFFSRFGFFG